MPKPVNKRVIQDGWTSFADAVLPANTPKIQRIEMRRAFFSGARFLLTKLTTFQADGGLLDPGSMETDRDLDQMAAIEQELADFGQALREGEA